MRTRSRLTGWSALPIAALLTISCGGINDPSTNQTDTVTGTVSKGGQSSPLAFSASQTGEFSIKVTSFTPSYSGQFGMWYGQGDGCGGVFQSNPFAIVNSPPLSGPIVKGSYCVVVYDLGGFPSNMTFTMTISHP